MLADNVARVHSQQLIGVADAPEHERARSA
jgi:hypothetical protein